LQTVNSQNGYLPVVTYAPEKIQCLYVWRSIDLAVLDTWNLSLTTDIEAILMYIEGVPNTVTLNTTWRWQAYFAPMTYCWGVDEPSHDAQEFMGHVSDWMSPSGRFLFYVWTSVSLRQETLECTKCVVAMPKVTDFFQTGSLVAHQALYWLVICSNL